MKFIKCKIFIVKLVPKTTGKLFTLFDLSFFRSGISLITPPIKTCMEAYKKSGIIFVWKILLEPIKTRLPQTIPINAFFTKNTFFNLKDRLLNWKLIE